jgi:hypothetical protein
MLVTMSNVPPELNCEALNISLGDRVRRTRPDSKDSVAVNHFLGRRGLPSQYQLSGH